MTEVSSTIYRKAFLTYDHANRRVWIFNQRLHHGAIGVFAIIAGTTLVFHDRRDWRDWFRFNRFFNASSLIINEVLISRDNE